jgi:hypothetical protein
MTTRKTTTTPASVPSDDFTDVVMTATGLDKNRIMVGATAALGLITFQELDEGARGIDRPTHPRTFRITEITTAPARHGGRAEVTPDGQRADMP